MSAPAAPTSRPPPGEREGVRALGLRLQNVAAAWATVGAVLAIYLLTMARDLTFYDSPELALVAHELGVGHPIGQPLHSLIGFPFAQLGLIGLTAMSALFGALCVIPAWSIAEKLVPQGTKWIAIAPPIAGCALHPIAWEPSTRVEVYTLAAFLSLWAVARAQGEKTWPSGLAFGLAVGANAVIAVAHGLALLPQIVRKGAKSAGLYVAAGLGGLLVYAYVPLASLDPARFAWGGATSPSAFFAYLRGADYAHNQGTSLAEFVDHALALAMWGVREASLPIAILGAIALAWRAKDPLRYVLPIAGLLCAAFVSFNTIFHVDVPDYRGYLLAPFLLAGSGVAALAAVLIGKSGRFKTYGGLVAALPLAALVVSPSHLFSVRDDPSLGRALVNAALAEAPRDAIVIVESDHWVAPLWYAQEAEGQREDVVIVAAGLAASSWYWEHLFARHPSLEHFQLQGGGNDGRLQRLIAANPDRRVLVESWQLAARTERRVCGVGTLVWTGECDVRPDRATRLLRRIAPSRGEALEVAARVGFARGEALWRLGRQEDAFQALIAGADAALPRTAELALPPMGPPLRGGMPAWQRRNAIHDPARNVFLIALLHDSIGDRARADAWLAIAAEMGLPEARERLARR